MLVGAYAPLRSAAPSHIVAATAAYPQSEDIVTITLPGVTSYLCVAAVRAAAAEQPNIDSPILGEDWLHKNGRTWAQVRNIHAYVLRAAAAFLRSRTTDKGHSTGPLGINVTQHFCKKCSHATTIGPGQLHLMRDLSRSLNPSKKATCACNDRILTLPDLRIAEAIAIWQAQLAFPPPKDVREKLHLIQLNGIFYVKGRLENSILSAAAQTPYYVPRKSVICKMLVMQYHKNAVLVHARSPHRRFDSAGELPELPPRK
ncbi:hypothetical protein AAVH_16273 [Aphelenchoides avenae]|nr:hypothetical protein AAVH_16273 [Aphelenchus avenae]